MDIFLARVFDGATAGSIYVLIGLSLVVVFRSSQTFNFAQGEFALFTCFVAWWLTTKGLHIWLALIPAVVIGFAMGVGVERTLIRRARRRDESAVLIVAVGLFIGLNGLDGWIWGSDDKVFPRMLPSGADDYIVIGGARLHYDSILVMLLMVAVVALLTLLLNRSSLGLQMRAVATNAESASLAGVKVGRVLALSWGISSAIGTFAGVLLVPILPPNQLNLAAFFPILVYAAAAGFLGGLDSVKGAVVGGLAFGVGESLITGYATFLGGSLPLTVAMAIIVVVLVLKPNGIFGTKAMERV